MRRSNIVKQLHQSTSRSNTQTSGSLLSTTSTSQDSSSSLVPTPFVLPIETLGLTEEEENNEAITKNLGDDSKSGMKKEIEEDQAKQVKLATKKKKKKKNSEEVESMENLIISKKKLKKDKSSDMEQTQKSCEEEESKCSRLTSTTTSATTIIAQEFQEGSIDLLDLPVRGFTQTQVDEIAVFNGDEPNFFENVLNFSGLTTENLRGKEGAYMLNASIAKFTGNVRSSLRTEERTRSFLLGFDDFFMDSSNIIRALTPLRSNSDLVTPTYTSDCSLVRVFLKIDNIQPHVIAKLLETFLNKGLEEDCSDGVPKKILQNLCWIDFVCRPSELSELLLQSIRSLSDAKNCLFQDAIQMLAEILPDSEHPKAVEQLIEILQETRESTAAIINSLTDLSVLASLQPQLIDTVLEVLKTSPVQDIPVIIKFLLTASANTDAQSQSNTIRKLRNRLTYLENTPKTKNSCSNDALVLKEFHQGLLMHRNLSLAYFESLKSDATEVTIDLWILFAFSRSVSYSATAKALLKKVIMKPGKKRWLNTSIHLQSSEGGIEFLEKSIVGHGAALENYFEDMLDLSSSYVRVCSPFRDSEAIRVVGSKLYQLMFVEMHDANCRQEIVYSLVSHCGAGVTGRDEVNCALRTLQNIVSSNEGAKSLTPFAGYIRSLLNDVERFDPVQGRMLFFIVSRLSLSAEEGLDELKILLRKLLMSPEMQRLHLGVIGTVQYATCLSPFRESNSEAMADGKKKKKTVETSITSHSDIKESISLIDNMLREAPLPFTFDELALIIEQGLLDIRVVKSLSVTLHEGFEDWFLFETDESSSCFGNALQENPTFDLNLGIDINVKILLLLSRAQSDVRSRDRLLVMCSMMRCLLASCALNGSYPDAILGCALMLPKMEALENLGDRTMVVREAVCSSFLYACNWIRELVSSFCSIPNLSGDLQFQVCRRFNTLVDAEKCLTVALKQVPEYFPIYSEKSETAYSSKTTSVQAAKKSKEPSKAAKKNKLPGDVSESEEDESSPDDASEGEDDKQLPIEKVPKRAKKQIRNPSPNESNIVDSRSLLRELSPWIVRILSFSGLEISFEDDEIDSSQSVRRDDCMKIHISTFKILLLSCVSHVSLHFDEKKSTIGWKKAKIPSDSRALEFETEAFLKLIIENCFPASRTFIENFSRKIKMMEEEGLQISGTVLRDSIDCVEAIAFILEKIVNYEPLRTQKGCEDILSCLRAFSSFPILSESVRNATFTEDQLVSINFKDLVAKATKEAYQFLVKETTESGMLSNTLSAQVKICSSLRALISLHDFMCESDEDKRDLRNNLSKLAKTLLRREWNGPGSPAVKLTKNNIGILLDLFHEYAINPLDAIHFTVTEMRIIIDPPKEDQALIKMLPLLTQKTLPIFYSCTLQSLVKLHEKIDDVSNRPVLLKNIPRLIKKFSSNKDLTSIRLLIENFSICILFTKTEKGSGASFLRDAASKGRTFLDEMIKKQIPKLSVALKTDQQKIVLEILDFIQKATRQLNNLCSHLKLKKQEGALSVIPGLRRTLETFLLSWKSLLKQNNCLEKSGFMVGILKLRDIDGSVVKIEEEEEE